MIPHMAVQHDLGQALLFYKDLPEAFIRQATPRALNRTAITVRAEAARALGKTYNIKVGAAKDQMKVQQATRTDLRATIKVSGRPIPLIEFDARQTAAGVTVKVKGARKVVGHAFIATMRSGHRGVYIRDERKSGKRPGRLPIRQLFSISLPVGFTQKQIQQALAQVIDQRFPEALKQEMRFVQVRGAR